MNDASNQQLVDSLQKILDTFQAGSLRLHSFTPALPALEAEQKVLSTILQAKNRLMQAPPEARNIPPLPGKTGWGT